MKMIHIAYYCVDQEAIDCCKRFFGLTGAEWIEDHVVADVNLFGPNPQRGLTTMDLQFNYDLGIELELQTFTSGPNLYQPDIDAGKRCFQSHHGIKLDDDEPFPDVDCPLIQEVFTVSHTNPVFTESGRKAHYKMYDSRPLIGDYVEHIRRVWP